MSQRLESIGDSWYRAEHRYIEDGSETYVGVEVELLEWRVVKVTRQGVWLACPTQPWRKKRFALSLGARAFRRTREEALDGLLARKRRQIRILESQMQVARDTIEAVAEMRRAAA